MTFSEKIKSIRQELGVEYQRPNITKVEQLQGDLQLSKEALDYLNIERGLTTETIKFFKLGYDKTKNAISIPHFKNGELINIKYRFLKPDKIKYVGEKGAESWIFHEQGMQEGLTKGGVLICEGEIDLMSAYQAGIKNVISPASGKDSYGVWLEMLDNIPKVYIAYDNDKGGKESAYKIAERVGIDKCYEVLYPEGIKDANDYFKKHTIEEYKQLIKNARPFYTYKFKGVGDIINTLRFQKENVIELNLLPQVKLEKDWMVVISGQSNIGKSSYALNLADELTRKGIGTLVLPFERGIDTVGKRFLQVKFNKTVEDFGVASENEWNKITEDCLDLPIYFSMPKKDDTIKTIIEAKRLFNTRVVIIDHLDYMIRHVAGNKESEIGNVLQDLKRVAEEHSILLLIITHIRKISMAGSQLAKKPNIEDLKGSSSLYQDPEVVVILSSDNGNLNVDVAKNKGAMCNTVFDINHATGRIQLSNSEKEFLEF